MSISADNEGCNLAVAKCRTMIIWYDENKRTMRLLYQISQVASIVLVGLTPILIRRG